MVWTNENHNTSTSSLNQHGFVDTNFRTGNGETMDKFAQRILEEAASTHSRGQDQQPVECDDSVSDVVTVDDNLGAYVVHSLQDSLKCASELPNSHVLLESLTELLQDQCRIQSPYTAQELLQQIADEVFAPRPHTQAPSTAYLGLSSILQDHDVLPQPIISRSAAQSLLPGALLEEEEDDDGDKPNTDDETAFPPLGFATDANGATPPAKHHHHYYHHNSRHRGHHSQQSSSNSDEASELAAALFRPTTRSRQSSMDETSSSYGEANNHRGNSASSLSPNLQPVSISEQQPPSTTASVDMSSALDPMLVQYSTEWLLNLNAAAEQPLSPDAAYAVTVLSRCDVNVAQYIVEQLLHHQLPVCRHLLQDGKCYRADCSFSHADIDTHTCLFWLKSRCTKGNDCRFLHGFHDKWLDQIPDEVPQYYDYGAMAEQLLLEHELQEQQQFGSYGSIDVFRSDGNPSSAWIPSPPITAGGSGGTSFVNVASQGYNDRQSYAISHKAGSYNNNNCSSDKSTVQRVQDLPTVPIPQDLWNPHENRDASAFYIADPLERYYTVTAAVPHRNDVIDLHFQSLQTFATVLDVVLPEKLEKQLKVWIVMGTGHHVGSRTHQKGGGTLERAVLDYLVEYYGPPLYSVQRGRDRNGQGGAVLVEQKVRGEALR